MNHYLHSLVVLLRIILYPSLLLTFVKALNAITAHVADKRHVVDVVN